jgi:L-fuconolactonase
MMQVIDSHQHFWQLARGDYAWLTPDLKLLYRDFMPMDLRPILSALNISGTVLVQAAPTLAETKFLLSLAEETDFVLGVVGWVDMMAADAPQILTQLTKESRYFRGIRPMIQEINNIDWMLDERLSPAFNTLIQLNLTFDALVLPAHLKNVAVLCERYPHLKIILDHGAKPAIKNKQFEPWASDLAKVAQYPNVFCKWSGLITEASPQTTVAELDRYIDHLFQCFGPHRILWGSDWPVLTLATSYQQWYQRCRDTVEKHFPLAVADVFGLTTLKIYSLGLR